MNTIGKSQEDLVQETVEMLMENETRDHMIRRGLVEVAEELKMTAREHNVLPAEIEKPIHNGKGEICLWIKVIIGSKEVGEE